MNSERIKECTTLASEILKNFEMSEIPIDNIIFKCLRLCRLLDDKNGMLLFKYESSGYPVKLEPIDWLIAGLAGRIEKDNNGKIYAYRTLVSELDGAIETQKIHLTAATDPSISLSSANPNQYIQLPSGNVGERNGIVAELYSLKKWRVKIVGNLHNYILLIYNRLMYGNIIEDIFTSSRKTVNEKLMSLCPDSIKKFVSVYDNMNSNNPEDWANAVHSCRRILQDLADKLFPPQKGPVTLGKKQISAGADKYINRLMLFIESKKSNHTFLKVVGADLDYIGNRLDAIYNATCKGSHSDLTKEEASRFIIHTYLLISDIITLSVAD